MRCFICNYCSLKEPTEVVNGSSSGDRNFTIDNNGNEICAICVKESRKYWVYRGNEGIHDASSNVETQVDELVRRIPGLLQGPSCPSYIPFSCKCTYETGCLELKRLDKLRRII